MGLMVDCEVQTDGNEIGILDFLSGLRTGTVAVIYVEYPRYVWIQ